MAKSFWRNAVLIALAHLALIVGLIRWSIAAKTSTTPNRIMWLGNTVDLVGEPEQTRSSLADQVTPVPEPPKRDEPEEKKTAVITAKSEIELTSPTPKPTLTAKPSVTVTPRPKPSPKPVRRPTPKKTLVAKASPKPSPKALKKRRSADRRGEIASVKRASPSQTRGEKTGSTDKNASAGVGNTMSEFGWYGNMLHDRFYRAWIQPTKNVAIGKKLSALVRLRIDKDGRVSRFDIIKPSGNTAVDESVRVVAKQVTEVDPPPTGLFKGDHYDVKINFELSTEEKVGN